jgi:tetratricopeptide (TPR) repeat protein
MVATRLPPTAEELDELSEAFRRDPGRAFVGLGDALLALGRPRDAVEIGARGLQVDPGNLAGRLMVARAFAALHQWKEAQAELLKVVKTDRNHGSAFRVLGEVLMRRGDYERALPVLQHAQNLSPADPSILSLLRRARAGQVLDPPPPIPTPLHPMEGGRGGVVPGGQPYPSADSGPYALDELPTRVAGEIDTGTGREWVDDPASVARVKLERVEQRRDSGRRVPLDGQVRRRDARGSDETDLRPVEHHMPPPTEDVFAPLGQDPMRERLQGGPAYQPSSGGSPPAAYAGGHPAASMPAASMPTAAMPPAQFGPGAMPAGMSPAGFPSGGVPGGFPPAGPPQHGGLPPGVMPSSAPSGVRPRVVTVDKPRDAAQASLRQSAAVGEQYLNNLLVGGLLDIPRVRVPDVNFDLAPGRRWGRSTVRLFIYLFVILFMSIGGAGAWYWYADRQRGEDVARHLETAMVQIDDGDYEGLARADQETRAAVERDRDNLYAVALLAEITALEAFLHGEIKPAEVQRAIELAAQEIDRPEEKGFRELLLARAAHTLAILPTLEDEGDARLAEVRRSLETWLAGHQADFMARWLHGHALWAAGDRKGARAAFEQADGGGQGPAIATTSLADMLLDDGEFEKARVTYDRALKKSPRHAWAFIGRSLTRSERSAEIQEAVGDVNVGVPQKRGPRVEAWKQLAMATAYLTQQDYEAFATALDKAVGVAEPRFLVRVGLLRMQQGRLADAARARSEIRWYADKPQPDPLVLALDAELRLASGMAREAFVAVEKEGGLRAARLRGRALFDLGRWEEAVAELDQALQISPRDLILQVWAESARLVVASGDDRRKIGDLLDSLGRQSKSKAARVPQAVALARTGRRQAARERLELSLKDVSAEYPNPLAYRAHLVLAEIEVADGKLDSAASHVDKALELNPGYLPTHDLACRLLVESAPDRARPHCVEVVKAETASVNAELAFVRTMMPARTPEETRTAADALRRARQKGASPEELQEYIPLIDPALFVELGVPEPTK